MGVGTAVAEGDELGECVGAFGAAEEGCVAALSGGDVGGGERSAAERDRERHWALAVVLLGVGD